MPQCPAVLRLQMLNAISNCMAAVSPSCQAITIRSCSRHGKTAHMQTECNMTQIMQILKRTNLTYAWFAEMQMSIFCSSHLAGDMYCSNHVS